MRSCSFWLRVVMLIALLLTPVVGMANSKDSRLLPNLIIEPETTADTLTFTDNGKDTGVSFDVAILNIGDGPLELFGDRRHGGSVNMPAKQRVYRGDFKPAISSAGTWHLQGGGNKGPVGSWELKDCISFAVVSQDRNWSSGTKKASAYFCDSTPLAGAGVLDPVYPLVTGDKRDREVLEGISVGWESISESPSLHFKTTGLPPGNYLLIIEVNLPVKIRETTRTDNRVLIPFTL